MSLIDIVSARKTIHSHLFNIVLLPEIDLAVKDHEVTYRDLDQAVNIAKAVAVLVHQWMAINLQKVINRKLLIKENVEQEKKRLLSWEEKN